MKFLAEVGCFSSVSLIAKGVEKGLFLSILHKNAYKFLCSLCIIAG